MILGLESFASVCCFTDDADRPLALWVKWPKDRAILRESKLARSTFAAKTTTMTLLRDREY